MWWVHNMLLNTLVLLSAYVNVMAVTGTERWNLPKS
ncbi:hypothetical protein M8C21_005764 [Ambrosia artemisiifolia]|uniref:Uncharacterized protein n=1 Tax=Ambrosia artemisiifolia TaxID=4212 RepID=A0AAD5BS72_AMBAR|nr:hypothetical protein M8C21_005764 [Ambrosia artemisiifolia]